MVGTGRLTCPAGSIHRVAVYRNPDPAWQGYRTRRPGLNSLTRQVQVNGSWTQNRPCSLLTWWAGLTYRAELPGEPAGLNCRVTPWVEFVKLRFLLFPCCQNKNDKAISRSQPWFPRRSSSPAIASRKASSSELRYAVEDKTLNDLFFPVFLLTLKIIEEHNNGK